MVFLEAGCLCDGYSGTAADPCLHPSGLLHLGYVVQPPPALAITDTHVTGQLPAKTRTLFFFSFSLVFHQLL